MGITETVRRKFNVQLLGDDMAAKGWLATDLAKKAGVSDMTVARFFSGEYQTNRTAKKLAKALNQSVGRYLIRASEAA